MKDKDFLQWIHNRLIEVHGEKETIDYMHKLRAIINKTPEEKETVNICSQNDIETEYIFMPKELTAENGSKYLMSGEFFESIDIPYICPECHNEGCEDCEGAYYISQKVPVKWSTIKDIYNKAVEYHGQ